MEFIKKNTSRLMTSTELHQQHSNIVSLGSGGDMPFKTNELTEYIQKVWNQNTLQSKWYHLRNYGISIENAKKNMYVR